MLNNLGIDLDALKKCKMEISYFHEEATLGVNVNLHYRRSFEVILKEFVKKNDILNNFTELNRFFRHHFLHNEFFFTLLTQSDSILDIRADVTHYKKTHSLEDFTILLLLFSKVTTIEEAWTWQHFCILYDDDPEAYENIAEGFAQRFGEDIDDFLEYQSAIWNHLYNFMEWLLEGYILQDLRKEINDEVYWEHLENIWLHLTFSSDGKRF